MGIRRDAWLEVVDHETLVLVVDFYYEETP